MEKNATNATNGNSQDLWLELDKIPQQLGSLEKYNTLLLGTGVKVQFDYNLIEKLTTLCIKHNVLQPNYKKEPLPSDILCIMENLLNIKVTNDDMEEILRRVRRIIYEKAHHKRSENLWFNWAPEWLCKAAAHLHLGPLEQVMYDSQLTLGREATYALLTHVQDTRMKLEHPVLELMWKDVCRLPLSKLDHVQKAGDRIIAGVDLSEMEWRIVDLVLLYSDKDGHCLITDERLKADVSRASLVATFEMVRRHRLVKGGNRSELARRWGRAYRKYTAKGHHTSLVLLQRRWHELMRRALTMKSVGPRDYGLLNRVKKYAATAPNALYSWSDLVAAGMVFTMQDVMEYEILRETPEWTGLCKVAVSTAEKPNLVDTEKVPEVEQKVKHDVDAKGTEKDEPKAGEKESKAPEATEANNYKLPIKTGRISSLLIFESDEEYDPSPNDFSDPDLASKLDSEVSSFTPEIINVKSEVVPEIKTEPESTMETELVMKESAIPPSLETKPILFETASEDVTTPVDVNVKSEPKETLSEVKVETENSETVTLDSSDEVEDMSTPEIDDSSGYVTFKGEIDAKILMDAKVLVERMDLHKYTGRRRSRTPRVVYAETEGESSSDSGEEWATERLRPCRSSLRRVTLRDIDEVRRRAQHKLTAQVAPVTQEGGSQDDQPASFTNSHQYTGPSRVVVEVTQYDPLGLKMTRLRYGQAMYKREMNAAAAVVRKRIRDQATESSGKKKIKESSKETSQKFPKRRRKKPSNKAPDDSTPNASDDMAEWIRQRNLNSQYFGPASLSSFTKNISQRRSSNPRRQVQGDRMSRPRYRPRPASLGKVYLRTPLSFSLIADSSPVAQHSHLSIVSTPTESTSVDAAMLTQPTTSVTSSVPSVLKELPASASPGPTPQEQCQPQGSLNDSSTSQLVSVALNQVVLTHSPLIVKQLPDGSSLIPVQILTWPGASRENNSVENNTDKPPELSQVDDKDTAVTPQHEKDTSEAMDTAPAIESSHLNQELTKPLDKPGPSDKPPVPALLPIEASMSLPHTYGTYPTVPASEYIKYEDASRLKVICKDISDPFWIVAGEYIMLSEKPTDTVMLRATYYTLAPPQDIKRIILGPSVNTNPKHGAQAAGSALLSAPVCMSVQGKVYRKLSSSPLRYAQVLYVLRNVSHARRALRTSAGVLVYSARNNSLTPLHMHPLYLNIYQQEVSEQIVIDE